MGHATANGLLENFSDVINNVDGGNRMIQVSMDGPSTSWTFFNLLQNDRVEKEQHNLIDIGSCSLHIKHGAFKTGAESCVSNMKVTLKGAFTILDHTPARREDYITHSHGQADVKRGFILNKNFLNQNMETLTITSCRKVKDHLISNKIVLHEFKVPSTLLQYTQSARQKYEVYLETSRSEKEQERKSKQINVTDQEIKKTEALRQQADKTIKQLEHEFITSVYKVEKENGMSLLSKTMAMKRKSTEKLVELSNLMEALNVLKEKGKNLMESP